MSGFPGPGLYGIADADAPGGRPVLEQARILVRGGAVAVQIRMKSATDREVATVVESLLPFWPAAVPLIVDDRVEIAHRYALGVHLGEGDEDPRRARDRLGDSALIGASTFDLDSIEAALLMPIDYVGFGPIFAAGGRHRAADDPRVRRSPRGVDALRDVLGRCRLPLVAIGGIHATNVALVRAAGARWAAAIGGVSAASDPEAAARAIGAALAA